MGKVKDLKGSDLDRAVANVSDPHDEIFPIYQYSTDTHFVVRPALAEAIWLRVRKDKYPEVLWYGLSILLLKDKVEVGVQSMRDSCDGGIGKTFLTFQVELVDLTDKELELYDQAVMARKVEIAAEEWSRREEARKLREISSIFDELFGDES